MKFKLFETISSYIKNPENKVLVINDPDTDVPFRFVENHCKNAHLKPFFDIHRGYEEQIQISWQKINDTTRLFAENDVLIPFFPGGCSKDGFEKIIIGAMKWQQELKKPLIVIGWFNEADINKYVEEGKVIADTVNYDVWMQWAKMPNENGESNIHPWVTSFLEKHPDYWLTLTDGGYPLGWKGVSSVLARVEKDVEMYNDPENFRYPNGEPLSYREKKKIERYKSRNEIPITLSQYAIIIGDKCVLDIRNIAAVQVGTLMAKYFAEYVQELKNTN